MSETQELIVHGGSEVVAHYGAAVATGLEDVAPLLPTNIQLVQPVTRDPKGARPGQFLDVLTEEAFDELVVVPLKVTKQRVYFPPGSDLDADPLCRSNDGKVPAPRVDTPQATSCASCPYSQWYGGQRPPCNEKLQFLFIVKEGPLAYLPRYFSVGGVSIIPATTVLKRIRQDIIRAARMPEPLHLALYDYYFTLKSEKAVGKKGTYYVARFDNVQRVANPAEFGPFYQDYVVQAVQHAQEQEAIAAEQAVDAVVNDVVDAEVVQEV